MTKSQCLTLGIALGIWATLLIKPVIKRHFESKAGIHIDIPIQKLSRLEDEIANCSTFPEAHFE